MTYLYRKLKEQDEQALTELLRTGFPLFLKNNYWTWKYKKNPYFEPSLVAVAEENGKIIGCNHWLMRDLKLSSDLKVRTALAGDLLIRYEHRGQGIAAELLRAMRSSEIVKYNGITLSYMFAPIKLNERLYSPVAGYISAPNSTSTYKKFFNCNRLKEKIQFIDNCIKSDEKLTNKLRDLRMSALFRLKGLPTFVLYIESIGVHLEEGVIEKPDVIIEGSLPLSSAIIEGKISVRDLTKAYLTGEIKIKKGILKIFKLRNVFMLFQKTAF